MTEITADIVRQLREMTGAPMMDTKRALVDADGDLEAAKQLLRERGMASASKRAGNKTPEGVVLTRLDDSKGTIVAIGSETEPVSKNDEFRAFAENACSTRSTRTAPTRSSRSRTSARSSSARSARTSSSAALPASRVETARRSPPTSIRRRTRSASSSRPKARPEAARRLAMHIAFAAPRFATRDEVPEDEIAKEREIYEKLPEVESKPEQARPKIVEGMLGKRFFAENVLAEQAWIHEPKKTVAQALEEEGLKVLEFERYALAE